jgi:hypothetical protein
VYGEDAVEATKNCEKLHYFAYRSGGFVSLEVLHFFSALTEFVFAESNLSYNICN